MKNNKPDITIIAKRSIWSTEQLIKAGRKQNLLVNVTDLKKLSDINNDNIGDVILWRSSSLDKISEKPKALRGFEKMGKDIINYCYLSQPRTPEKIYQYNIAKEITGVIPVDTFTYENKKSLLNDIKKGILKYPFIQKPNWGARGRDVVLVEKEKNIETEKTEESVFQNFIENNGDFRAWVIGGKCLGVMKRSARKGEFLNNYSRGGYVKAVKDGEIIEKLGKQAIRIAGVFDLAMCGVDFIYDESIKDYRMLEVNTAPQWQGFQKSTRINVSREIIKYCNYLLRAQKVKNVQELAIIIKEYYKDNADYLYHKKFHFWSRLYLWSFDIEAKKELRKLRRKHIGKTEKEQSKIIRDLSIKKYEAFTNLSSKDLKLPYIMKYAQIRGYNLALFRNMFARITYNVDMSKYIEKHLSVQKLLKLKNELLNDHDALLMMSTTAINYLYILRFYFRNSGDNESGEFDVNKIYEISKKYPSTKKYIGLKIYYLTHCILGESNFYTQKVKDNSSVYKKMCKDLDDLIEKNYFDVSLDSKFEFLVSARLCDYRPKTEKKISEEALKSISKSGLFIIDTLSKPGYVAMKKKDMVFSEHRNALFILAFTPMKIK